VENEIKKMRLRSDARGVYVIAPTPFHPDGQIDISSIDRMTDFFVAAGVDGMTVLGQLGEAPKMTHHESLAIVRQVVTRISLPVVVGVSAPGFAAMRALTQDAMAAGAAGVMIAPPNTLRTDDAIVQYYRQASEAIGGDVPFVVQDYPLTFSVQMAPGVIRRIVAENPACVMLKHEDWPGLEKIAQLRAWEREGAMRHVAILTGNNALFLDFEMERGADGANTGYCFPDMLVDTVRLAAQGRRDEAHDLFDAHLPLIRYEQQPGVGLAVRKYVMMRRGIIASETLRSPRSALTPSARAEVEYLMARLATKDPRARVTPL
jgi:4-hydroxy-tetrahydrodipicolinate synthase